ncbi:glutathione S-transferase family protein [Bradyrhizobium sp. RDI18]|uniref:glutathione S-transferase family protein n=1 Tax=Bradyrhizobium sp. RDI18 TaxID=3367400 RepID=UPI003722AFB8
MAELILHHYDFSNYSEKVRVALGYKSLDWSSVIVPPVTPKPDLTALTGGYRRAPVLQIGADIYCDTRLILRELERRHPLPSLYSPGQHGFANAVAAWAEGPLFRSVMLYAWGTNHDLMPPELFEDRARMRGLPVPSVKSVERVAARSAPLVRTQMSLIEDMLADGRPWICGPNVTVADLAIFHAMWFLTDRSSRLAHEFNRFELLRQWMSRVKGFGHGRPRSMSAGEALEIARASLPSDPRTSLRQPEDPKLGSRVEVRAADYARDAIVGTLTFVDDDELAVGIHNDRVGDVVVHFPRIGFELREER